MWGSLLKTQLFSGLAFTIFETVFALFAKIRLGLDARTTNYAFTYLGILVVLVQGVGIRLLIRRFTNRQMVFSESVLLALSLVG